MKINTIVLSGLTMLGVSHGLANINVDFSDVALTTPPATSYAEGGVYYNGSDGAGSFTSGGVTFINTNPGGYWEGWSYSTTSDTTTSGFTNQYSAYSGSGYGDAAYGIYFQPFNNAPTMELDASSRAPQYMRVTNTTYAALSMIDGDQFAKAFGGVSGDDEDWFLLTIRGFDSDMNEVGTVDHYLADYRFEDNSQDYILDDWDLVDLTSLGSNVASLQFELTSSDVGTYGMNTPAYFAMDDFYAVPEPSRFALFAGVLALFVICRRNRR
ncbi:DUF4465 domain-containing protein [Coraliomargarita sp. SDUM461004]|uniref:DUF4465 domain-containing protein n=1 Tax=Thalassobacterium sedimentorum TaxID=3041258 RepID=A0ABU1AJL1_9BACT|nr:DUF4465 domain-containing protein [Coraliomargarita sp. SDUM461004]MDQ8195005.1 DUF4465 domain-containing protein [Coraliomargarita sp. SDUM461004]